MKNLYDRFDIDRSSATSDMESALDCEPDNQNDARTIMEAKAIMKNPLSQSHYGRVHLQYLAIAAARQCLQSSAAVDTHRWVERLVEFDVDNNNSLND